MKPVEGQNDCDWLNFPTIMIHSNIVRHHCFVSPRVVSDEVRVLEDLHDYGRNLPFPVDS